MILDPRHVVAECIEKAGRRIVGRLGRESAEINQLVFQAGSPLSVADLVFRGPATESSCVVRGQLFVSGTPARLECQLDWTRRVNALPPEIEIELSPGWITDRVLMRGVTDPLVWHASALESGRYPAARDDPGECLQRKEISLVVQRELEVAWVSRSARLAAGSYLSGRGSSKKRGWHGLIERR